jgi:CubicO group peptidase (beta-lactamase class C family)
MQLPRSVVPLVLASAALLGACSGGGSTDTKDVDSTAAPAPAGSPTTTAPVQSTDSATTTAAPSTTAAPASTAQVPEYDFAGIAPIVEAFVTERGLNGAGLVVVHRDHGVIHEGYWGEFGPDRVSLVASSSKMVTAGVLLHLADEGLLDMDAPVADAVEWGAGNPTITPAQLVSNSSGLVGLLPDPTYGPYVCQFLPAGTMQECAASIFGTADDDADVVAPDTEFRYGGAQWQIAGAVAEAVSGTPWAQLVEEIYVQPCGLESLGYNNHFSQFTGNPFAYPEAFGADPSTLQATDNPNMEGGMYTDPGDYAALLLMHLRGGRCGDEQVLSTEALSAMHTDRIGEVYDGSTMTGSGYGMGWWVDRETGRLTDPGAYGSVPWLDLEDGYGAYLVIEADATTGAELAGQLYDVVETAVTGA